MNLPQTIEADAPSLENIPEKAQQYLALAACGFSYASIARLAGVSPAAVRDSVLRYDPKKQFSLTKNEKSAFLRKLWEARAGEALMFLTPEKLENASASQLASIARTSTKILNEMPEKEEDSKEPSEIISSLSS